MSSNTIYNSSAIIRAKPARKYTGRAVYKREGEEEVANYVKSAEDWQKLLDKAKQLDPTLRSVDTTDPIFAFKEKFKIKSKLDPEKQAVNEISKYNPETLTNESMRSILGANISAPDGYQIAQNGPKYIFQKDMFTTSGRLALVNKALVSNAPGRTKPILHMLAAWNKFVRARERAEDWVNRWNRGDNLYYKARKLRQMAHKIAKYTAIGPEELKARFNKASSVMAENLMQRMNKSAQLIQGGMTFNDTKGLRNRVKTGKTKTRYQAIQPTGRLGRKSRWSDAPPPAEDNNRIVDEEFV